MDFFIRLWNALLALVFPRERTVPARLRMATPLGVRRLEDRRVLNADVSSAVAGALVMDNFSEATSGAESVSVADDTYDFGAGAVAAHTFTLAEGDWTSVGVLNTSDVEIDGGDASILHVRAGAFSSITVSDSVDTNTANLVFSNTTTIDFGTTDVTSTSDGFTVGFAWSQSGDLSATAGVIAINSDITTQAGGSGGDISLSGSTITVAANASIDSTAADTGDVAATATRRIVMNASSSITTADGDINLSANQQPLATSGNFIGIDLQNASITSQGTGAVSLAGRGGDGGADQHGVRISGATSLVASTGGTVSVIGVGGHGTDSNRGFDIGAGGQVVGGAAGVTVVGTGGSNGAAGSNNNVGVFVHTGGRIQATSTGTVVVTGTGGAGDSGNAGVVVTNSTSTISSESGMVTVTGIGGADSDTDGGGPDLAHAGSSNNGVQVQVGGRIQSDSGQVVVDGYAATIGVSFNYGIYVTGVGSAADSAQIVSTGGGVLVNGTGGGATGNENHGVFVSDAGLIHDNGSGTVTVQGTGGESQGTNNYGVYVLNANSKITSGGGAVSVTGQGGGLAGSSSTRNYGVAVINAGTITSGTGGAVVVDGTGGDVGSFNYGVNVSSSSALISSGTDGNVTVSGQGGGGNSATSANNDGVFVSASGQITAGGTGVVDVDGIGGIGAGNNNHGVTVSGATSRITSNGGNVDVSGQGGGTATSTSALNYGVYVTSSGEITAGSTADVAVTGTGGATQGNQNHGVFATGSGSIIHSNGGNVTVAGQGGGIVTLGTSPNHGVYLVSSARIFTLTSGEVVIAGAVGANGGQDVLISGASTAVQTDSGKITITGLVGNVRMDSAGTVLSNSGNADIQAANDVLLGVVNLDLDGIGNAGTACIIADADTTTVDPLNGVVANGTGAIVDNLSGEAANVVAAAAAFQAGSGIGSDADDIDTAKAPSQTTLTLAAATDSGDINIRNVGSLTVGTVCGIDGVEIRDIVNAGGATPDSGLDNIHLIAVGSVQVNQTVVNADGGDILIAAQGTDSDLTVSADLTANVLDGAIALYASRDVSLSTTTALTLRSNGSNLIAAGEDYNDGTVTAGSPDGDVAMDNGVLVTSDAGGQVTIRATKDVTLAEVVTSGTAVITADSDGASGGAIIDADAGSGIDITAATIDLNAGSGIGAANALELSGSSISADTTSGNVDLSNAATAAVTVSSLSTGAGTIDYSQTGNQSLTVTSATTTAGTITIANTGGDFTATSVTAGGAGNVQLTTTTSGNVLLGNVTAADNTVTVTSAGAINDASVDTLTDITAATIDLNAEAGIGNSAALELSGSSISADTTSGNVDLSNAATAAVTVSSLTTGGSGDTISYTQTGTQALTTQTVSTNNGDIALDTDSTLTIDGDMTAGTGDVTLTADGAVTQNAGDVITAAGLLLQGNGSFTLDDAGNNVGTLAANTNGSILYHDADSLEVGTVNSVNGITTSNDDVTLCATAITLTQTVNVGNGTVRLHANDTVTPANGNITQTGGSIIAAALGAIASGDIELGSSGNDVDTFAANAGGDIHFVDADGYTLGTVTAADCFDETIGLTAGGDVELCIANGDLTIAAAIGSTGTLRLNAAAGNVTQTAGGVITAANLGVLAQNNITLSIASNNVTGVFAAISTTLGNVQFNDLGGFTVGTITAGGCLPEVIGITATSGAASATSTGTIMVDDAVFASGSATLTANGATSDVVVNAGSGGVTSANGPISLTAGRDVTLNDLLAVTTGTGGSDVNAGAAVAINAAISTRGGDVDVDAGTDVTSTANGTIVTTAAANSGIASGDVTINAGLTAAGNINLAAVVDTRGAVHSGGSRSDGGDITLHADNGAGGTVDAVNLFASGGNNTGFGGDGGNVIVTAQEAITVTGDITTSGGTSSLVNGGAAGDVTVTSAADAISVKNVFAVGGQGDAYGGIGGAATITAAEAVVITGEIRTDGGVGVNVSGGAAGDISVTSQNSSVDAVDLSARGGAGAFSGGAGGDIAVIATTDLVITGTVNASGGNAGSNTGGSGGSVLLCSTGSAIEVNDVSANGGDGGATSGNGGRIAIDNSTGVGSITLNGTLSAVAGTGAALGTDGTVSLLTAGAIVDNDDTDATDVQAGELQIQAQTGIAGGTAGTDNARLEVDVATLAASTEAGDIVIHDNDAASLAALTGLTIGSVTDTIKMIPVTTMGVTIVDTSDNDSGSDLIAVSSVGPLTANAAVSNLDGGDVTLSARTSLTATPSLLTINANVSTSTTGGAGTGRLFLDGEGVTVDNNAAVTTETGLIAIDAGPGDSGIFTMAGGTSVSTTDGHIFLSADHASWAGSISTTNGAILIATDTPSHNIQLGAGATDSAGNLGLTDVELNTLSAPTILIGINASTPADYFGGEVFDSPEGLFPHLNPAGVLGNGETNNPFGGATTGTITVVGDFVADSDFATDLFQLQTTTDVAINAAVDLTANLAGDFNVLAGRDITQTGAAADVTTAGDGFVEYTAGRLINITDGSITTTNGDITLTANDAGTTSGNFIGVTLNNADMTTGTPGGIGEPGGDILVAGTGGNSGSLNIGVLVTSGSNIVSFGSGTTAGMVTIDGAGGAGTGGNVGVRIEGSSVNSVDGDVSITGVSDGTTNGNRGVQIMSGSLVMSSGVGTNAAKITIDGIGAAGVQDNEGVAVNGSTVTAVAGDILITGTGQGTGVNNIGVHLQAAAAITSTGTGTDAATVTINGTGGTGTDNNSGVVLESAGTRVASVDGDINVTGTASGTGSNNNGLSVLSVAVIESTGSTSNAAVVTLTGIASTAGTGDAVQVGDAIVRSNTAPLTITGVNDDIRMTGSAQVQSNSGNAWLQASNDIYLTVVNLDLDAGGAQGTAFITADADTTAFASGQASDSLGEIIDNEQTSGDAVANITALAAVLRAGSGIGNTVATPTNDIDLTVTNLSASTADGDIFLSNSQDLNITSVGGQAGVVNSGSNDAIKITVDGNLQVQRPVSNGGIGSTTLDARGDITANATISSSGGVINILADQNVTLTPLGDVSSQGGAITVRADQDGTGGAGAGAILMADSGGNSALIDASSGTVQMTATNDITLGGVSTTNGTSSAVVISSTFGAIVDGGDTALDITAENPTGLVTLAAFNGVGVGNSLETSVARLSANVTGTGGVELNEVSMSGVELVHVATADGAVLVTSLGEITATRVDTSATQNNTNDISLTTTGVGADILVTSINAGSVNDVHLTSADDVLNTSVALANSIVADDLIIRSTNNTADGATAVQLQTQVQDLTANVLGGHQGNIQIVEVDDLNLATADTLADSRTVSTSNGVVGISTGGDLIVVDNVGGNDDASRTSDVEVIGGGPLGGVNFVVGGNLRLQTYAQIDAYNAGLTPPPASGATVNEGSVVVANSPIVSATVQGDTQLGEFSQVRTLQAGSGAVVGVARQIAPRPDMGPPPTDGTTAFYDASSVIAPTLTRVGAFFQATLTVAIGQPGESGLTMLIDWGTDAANRFETITGLTGGQTYTFVHNYAEFELLDSLIRRSSAADPLSVQFGVSMEGSVLFRGNSVTSSDGLTTMQVGSGSGVESLTSTDLLSTALPSSNSTDGTFVENGQVLFILPAGVGSGIPNFLTDVQLPVTERSLATSLTTTVATSSIVTTDRDQQIVLQVLGREEYLELRVVSPDPEAAPLAVRRLPDEFLAGKEGASFIDLFDGLPDGTYEIWYVLGSNRRLLVRVEVRDGKPEVQQDELDGGRMKLEEIIDRLRDEIAPGDAVTQQGEPVTPAMVDVARPVEPTPPLPAHEAKPGHEVLTALASLLPAVVEDGVAIAVEAEQTGLGSLV
ncbi:MAG: beta strand repeat-containing protein, partial [Planctomycetaceae bacterium]